MTPEEKEIYIVQLVLKVIRQKHKLREIQETVDSQGKHKAFIIKGPVI